MSNVAFARLTSRSRVRNSRIPARSAYMAASNSLLDETLSVYRGFDTGAYTLFIGPEHKRLVVPGYILLSIPPLAQLIIDGTLLEHEPVALEAYDPKAFATILALLRDGCDRFEAIDTSQDLIKAYIVAFDLGLEGVQNFLIDQIKGFYLIKRVQPRDFGLLYSASLSSDCKAHALLLHKMAHNFHSRYYRKSHFGKETDLSPEYVKEMECLGKADLIQLVHQLTFVSAKWRCEFCEDVCYFHEHSDTPICGSSHAPKQTYASDPGIDTDQATSSARDHRFVVVTEPPCPNPQDGLDTTSALTLTNEAMSKPSDSLGDDVSTTIHPLVVRQFGESIKTEDQIHTSPSKDNDPPLNEASKETDSIESQTEADSRLKQPVQAEEAGSKQFSQLREVVEPEPVTSPPSQHTSQAETAPGKGTPLPSQPAEGKQSSTVHVVKLSSAQDIPCSKNSEGIQRLTLERIGALSDAKEVTNEEQIVAEQEANTGLRAFSAGFKLEYSPPSEPNEEKTEATSQDTSSINIEVQRSASNVNEESGQFRHNEDLSDQQTPPILVKFRTTDNEERVA